MDMQARCAVAESIMDYEFKDAALLEEALTAAGNYRRDAMGTPHSQGNASLAFIGDAIIRVEVGISSRRKGLDKGATTEEGKRAGANNVLASKCETNGLAACILQARGAEFLSIKIMAAALEGVIGAVFLDGGYEAASRVMATLGVI